MGLSLKAVGKQGNSLPIGENFDSINIGGINGNYSINRADSETIWSKEVAKIKGEEVEIKVGNKLTNKGGIIGSTNKQLNIEAKELELVDLENKRTSKQEGYGININVGITSNQQNNLMYPGGKSSIKLSKQETTSSSSNLATITTDNISTNETKTTKHTNRKLNAELTIDNRLLTQKGREEVIGEIQQSAKNLNQNIKDIKELSTKLAKYLTPKTNAKIKTKISELTELEQDYKNYLEQVANGKELSINHKELLNKLQEIKIKTEDIIAILSNVKEETINKYLEGKNLEEQNKYLTKTLNQLKDSLSYIVQIIDNEIKVSTNGGKERLKAAKEEILKKEDPNYVINIASQLKSSESYSFSGKEDKLYQQLKDLEDPNPDNSNAVGYEIINGQKVKVFYPYYDKKPYDANSTNKNTIGTGFLIAELPKELQESIKKDGYLTESKSNEYLVVSVKNHSHYANEALIRTIVYSNGEKSINANQYNAIVVYSYNFSMRARRDLTNKVVTGVLTNNYKLIDEYWLNGNSGNKVQYNIDNNLKGLNYRRVSELDIFYNGNYCNRDEVVGCYGKGRQEIVIDINKDMQEGVYKHNPDKFIIK